MSNIILSTIKDLMNNEIDLINKRYQGDSEFNGFKKFLRWKRSLLVCINSIIFIISLIILILSIISIIKNPKIISNYLSFLLSLGLLFFSANNSYELSRSKRYLKIKNTNEYLDDGKIFWDEWQFEDIIFHKPIKLDREYNLEFNSSERKYCFYLILQYPNGTFGYYLITNQSELNKNVIKRADKIIKINSREILPIIEIEKVNLQSNNRIRISHQTIINDMLKDDYNLNPEKIVGIRIRSNILNEKTNLNNINLKN